MRYLIRCLIGALLLGPQGCAKPQMKYAMVGDISRYASRMVTPPYPSSSRLRHHQGVVVLSLLLYPDSHSATSITVLQAPDRDIARACTKALQESRFSLPFGSGSDYVMKGKAFYFFSVDPTPRISIE